jgi:hypothetical protein
MTTSTINLINFTIRQLPDKNGNTYYLIKDEATGQGYFCFSANLNSEDWTELETNWQNLKELQLDYWINDQGYNQVSKIYTEPDIYI